MFNYQGRLFTFGCSMVKYHWPTWADILGRKFSYYENWGKCATGNQYIFNSLVECYTRNKFSKNDTVIIMWATVSREDRYNNGWNGVGNVYSNEIDYGTNNTPSFDDRGYLIRDLAVISAAKSLLETAGVNYYFLSTVPIVNKNVSLNIADVLELYKDTIAIIKPSIYEIIFNFDWYSRPTGPNINTFPNESYINQFIKKTIATTRSLNKLSIFSIRSNKTKDKILHTLSNVKSFLFEPRDFHPTPLEHLEYLQTVFPNIIIDADIKQWVVECNEKIMGNEIIDVALSWWQDSPAIPKIRL
jgi:hypothetical protein